MALSDNLISYYSLGEASGNAIDAHGSNDLTETGGTIASATGKVGDCRDFEAGDTEHFEKTAAIVSAFPFSVAAWINLESHATPGVIFAIGTDAGGPGIIAEILVADDGKLQIYCETGPALSFKGATTLSTGTWYHVVGVFKSGDFRIYLNGVLDGSDATSLSLGTVNRTHVGVRIYSGSIGEYFDGLIDEVPVWDRELTTDEITWLAGGGGRSYAQVLAGIPSGNPHNYYAQQQ